MSVLRDEWLEMSEEDFGMAMASDIAISPRGVCFHCQQCIEMLLKAACAHHGLDPRKTHDLAELVLELADVDARFEALLGRVDALTPHAVATRYGQRRADAADAEAARQLMLELRTEIRAILGLEDPASAPMPGVGPDGEARTADPEENG